MIGQAAGFAVLSALTPAALVASAFYLGSANPRRTLLMYLAGAITMTVIVGVVILLAIHTGGLNHPRQRQPRYGLRLGLGVVALAASLFVARRRPRPAKPAKPAKPGLITRMMTHPAPLAAFAVGALIFAPSVAFVAAVQAIATAKASDSAIALALALVIVIDVILAWLPLGLYLAMPAATTRTIKTINTWLQVHSRVLIVTVLALVGILLVADGATGLAT